MNVLSGIIAAAVTAVFLTFAGCTLTLLEAWAATKLWVWFMEPHLHMALPMAVAIGASLLVGALWHTPSRCEERKRPSKEVWLSFAYQFMRPLGMVLFGAIIRWWIA